MSSLTSWGFRISRKLTSMPTFAAEEASRVPFPRMSHVKLACHFDCSLQADLKACSLSATAYVMVVFKSLFFLNA